MKDTVVIYWSRRDLRLRDNRALANAIAESKTRGIPFLPVFCIEPYMTDGDPAYQFGYPSRYFLAHALPEFAKHFKDFLLAHEKPAQFFKKLSKTFTLEIYVNEDIHPDFYTQIRKIRDSGIAIKLFRDQLTIDKETKTGAGEYYSIFTPFKKAVWYSFIQEKEDRTPDVNSVPYFPSKKITAQRIDHKNPKKILDIFSKNESIIVGKKIIDITTLSLPKRSYDMWYFSEAAALKRFDQYLKKELASYDSGRDLLGEDRTSRMSLALTWGLVSARTLKNKIQKHFGHRFDNPSASAANQQGALSYLSELIWREFYKYLYFHNPKLASEPFQKKFKTISWIEPKEAQRRFILWIQGKTGYPLVDAAMMQLAQTGWMHNRARMVVASILTKNLGVDWRFGQEYFRAMLVDLDESSNNGGWQWGASVGADPKPIRIFNPYLQAKNYDPEGAYQKKWLDEEYQKNPPAVIIEHEKARKEALLRYGLKK